MGLSSAQAEDILTEDEISAGMVFPVVANTLLGSAGTFLMMILMLFAVMSTGAGQVIAISSMIIYDIYQPYVRPFRDHHKANEPLSPPYKNNHRKTIACSVSCPVSQRRTSVASVAACEGNLQPHPPPGAWSASETTESFFEQKKKASFISLTTCVLPIRIIEPTRKNC